MKSNHPAWTKLIEEFEQFMKNKQGKSSHPVIGVWEFLEIEEVKAK